MLFLEPKVVRTVAFSLFFLLTSLAGTGQSSVDPTVESSEARVVALTNEARRKVGLEPLARVSYLERAARGHSTEMLERNFFSHYSPTPGRHDSQTRIRSMGGWDTLTGENIYRCRTSDPSTVAERAVGQWLRSPVHYQILMNPEFNSIGVGIARRGNQFTVTQDFSCQTIEILSFTVTSAGHGFDVLFRGRVHQGSTEGALFANNVLKERFRADANGDFEVRASVPARTVLSVSQKTATNWAPRLAMPVEAGVER